MRLKIAGCSHVAVVIIFLPECIPPPLNFAHATDLDLKNPLGLKCYG